MQALKNKLHRNSAADSNGTQQKHHLFGKHNTTAQPLAQQPGSYTTSGPAPASALRETEAIAHTLPHGSTVERIENKTTTFNNAGPSTTTTEVKTIETIPMAPAAPAVWFPERSDRWLSLENLNWTRGVGFFPLNSSFSSSSSYGTRSSSSYLATEIPATAITTQQLPVEIIEKPVVVHEEIRREQIEEIQPVVNIEKLKTEVHQVTQPLFDKEIKSVNLQQRELASEILPEINLPGRGIAAASDFSTIQVRDSANVVVEKPAIYQEVDKIQVIEEIQPVLYKETVVPTVIQETKPIYQKIVEGANYHQETLQARSLQGTQYERGFEHEKVVPLVRAAAPLPSHIQQQLPVEILEKPIVVHEEIKREQVEEIQPVINIEKLKTEVHQVTQPLFDKEVKAVNLQQRVLAAEVLPEIDLPGRGASWATEASSVHYQDRAAMIIEKPAVYNEVDRIQVIEEIQPVLYKETIVPTVIQETKQIYQKVVEGTVYTQETLPPRQLHGTQYSSYHTSTWTDSGLNSGMRTMDLGAKPIFVEKVVSSRPDTIVETTKTTTTTTTQNQANLPTYAL